MNRAVIAVAITVAACGPAKRARPPQTITREAGADASARDAAIEAGPDRLALLAARADELAPGARELAREDLDATRERELKLGKLDASACLRAAFDADAPTKISLVDAHGRALGGADGTEGAIGAAGPVCFRAGDAPAFRFEGSSRVRIVVWSTP